AYAMHEKQEAASVHVTPPPSLQSNNAQPTNTPTNAPTNIPSPDEDSSNGDTTPTTVVSPTVALPTDTPTPRSQGQYKDGEYTGQAADAFYGNIQVKAVIQGGKITDVQFLQYPSDRSTSIQINQQAMPYLKQEAIQVQSAQVDIVSGATDSS